MSATQMAPSGATARSSGSRAWRGYPIDFWYLHCLSRKKILIAVLSSLLSFSVTYPVSVATSPDSSTSRWSSTLHTAWPGTGDGTVTGGADGAAHAAVTDPTRRAHTTQAPGTPHSP